MALEIATDFSQVNPKGQMVKISPTFPERVIRTVCYTAQMYKVELRVRLKTRFILSIG